MCTQNPGPYQDKSQLPEGGYTLKDSQIQEFGSPQADFSTACQDGAKPPDQTGVWYADMIDRVGEII